ncbi:MAG: VWA domain-containing protein [Pseudorhizobium sp.]
MKTCHQISRLLNDRSGNFGMMTAILLPVLLGAGGLALDLTNMMMSKTQLQEASDSAALAAATALASGEATSEAQAKAIAKEFFLGQMGNYMGEDAASALAESTDVDINTTTSSAGKKFAVSVGSSYQLPLTPLMGVLGYQTMAIAASSVSTSGIDETRRALTMALVLDESGSMAEPVGECVRSFWGICLEYDSPGVTKMAALKAAAKAMFDALDNADPNKKLVRTAVYTYDQKMVSHSAAAWGTTDARKEVLKIKDDDKGTTNATEALDEATDDIKPNTAGTDRESTEHRKKTNTEIDRFLVFMTDGQMTDEQGRWSSRIDKEVRLKCDEAKAAKIHIYSVALKTPDNGKKLLSYCASSSSDYYEVETMDKLVEAFQAIANSATKADTRLTN